MAIGAVIALIAVTLSTLINSIGYMYIKLSILHTEKSKANFLTNWRYVFAIFLLGVGALVNFGKIASVNSIGSLAFADMITLTSTSSLTMVFNSLLASKVLKEVFTKYDLISIGLISLGSTLCIFFSNYEEQELTNDVSI